MTEASSTSTSERAIAEALWQQLLADFDNELLHQKALDHARQSGDFASLAKRYRTLSDRLDQEIESNNQGDNVSQQARRERCQKRLAAIAIVATHQLRTTDRAPAPSRTTGRLVALAVIALITTAVFALASY